MVAAQEVPAVVVTPNTVFCKVARQVFKVSECVERAESSLQCFNCVLKVLREQKSVK